MLDLIKFTGEHSSLIIFLKVIVSTVDNDKNDKDRRTDRIQKILFSDPGDHKQ